MDVATLKSLAYETFQSRPSLTAFLIALGTLSVVRLVYQTIVVLAQIFVLPGKSLKKFGAKQGAWAVVTGATDGIGKEFALQLAKAGFNILLVARNKDLLAQTSEEIQTKYNVSSEFHSIDFAKADEAAYNGFAAACEGRNIGVLVNNVGKSHNMPVNFAETPSDEMNDILTINCNATLRVTYTVLPGMVQHKRGLILNIGSFAGAVPSPMLATYSASKAFLTTFTSALAEEVKKDNITVEHVNTYFVVSKLSKIRKPTPLIPYPAPFVRSVLSKIGLPVGAAFSGRPSTSTPFWSHALLDYVMTLLGGRDVFMGYTHNLHKDIRRRALKKAEREAKKA
ncbi:3-ketoacyl-CoA reductase [Panaeolus papilionaceus]|nr:3-ketoacyl-CoA reductase [Panaeolus papilionaceus]